MMRRLLVLFGIMLSAGAQAAEPTPERLEFFEKKIRPLLASQCFSCHSSAQKVRGGLQLDSHAGLMRGGDSGPAIVAGDPDKSRLIQAVRYLNDLKMPKQNKLSDEAIADLTAWVKMGAPWPKERGPEVKKGGEIDIEALMKHWAYQRVRRPALPSCANSAWVRDPVDAFILARLEKEGLRPAPEAAPHVWLRRVTLSLTGLPPTLADLDAFETAAKQDPERAREQVVDRLLASPAYGERWGRHWLDLVRFAETSGHEFDFEIPEAAGYRDYVIRAFNADVPYDQFVREHLAGDLLPQPRRRPDTGTNESILGTGFWFLGESKHSPVDVRGDGADRRDNMIDVFGKTFLGLTISCARCHDHKFDPIPTADYYSLVGYLQSSRFERVFIDPPDVLEPGLRELRELRAEANRRGRAQACTVLQTALKRLPEILRQAREGKAPAEIARHLTPAELNRADHPLHLWGQLGGQKDEKAFAAALERERNRGQLMRADRVFADFSGEGYGQWLRTGFAFEPQAASASDLLLALERPIGVARVRGPHSIDGGVVSTRLQGAIRSPSFTIEKKHILYRVAGKGAKVNLIIDGFQQIRDPIYGGLTFSINHGNEWAWHVQNVSMWKGLRAYIEVLDDGDGFAALDRVVFSDEGPPPVAPNALAQSLVKEPNLTLDCLPEMLSERLLGLVERWRDGKVNEAAEVALLNGLIASPLMAALAKEVPADAELLALQQKIQAAEARLPTPRRGLGLCDGSGDDEAIYIRGNHKNLGEAVPRRFLVALAGTEQKPHPRGSGRLEMAERLLDEQNPLAARVIVNRVWQHHFGRGIVASVDNFGIQGQLPSHPELLDWLADEFRHSGWSLKRLHRRLVLSSTYRMASQGTEESETKDPANRLWHRMPVQRVQAEVIRDGMLALSGRLVHRMYGRGPNPFLTEHMQGRGRPAGGPLDGEGRRSIYLNVRRNFINPLFLAFDYPLPISSMGQRSVSNVPAQALTLLNNPFVLQEARRWAERELAQPGTPPERITRMYRAAFGRSPTPAELADGLEFITAQGREYGKPDDPRAWADFAHVLFNVKDFVFIE